MTYISLSPGPSYHIGLHEKTIFTYVGFLFEWGGGAIATYGVIIRLFTVLINHCLQIHQKVIEFHIFKKYINLVSDKAD